MTETAEPFAVYFAPGAGEVNDPLARYLPPDIVEFRRAAILQRQAEQAERRKEAQRKAEWQGTHDKFTTEWEMARRFELAVRGRDPNDPRNLPRSVDEVAARAFYEQDAEVAERVRQAKAQARQVFEDAGLPGQHLVNAGSPSPPPAEGPSAGSPSPGAVARATPVGSRIRAVIDRWGSSSGVARAAGCGCAACIGEAVHRTADDQPEITRFTYQYGD
jgi:hypothetical protein